MDLLKRKLKCLFETAKILRQKFPAWSLKLPII